MCLAHSPIYLNISLCGSFIICFRCIRHFDKAVSYAVKMICSHSDIKYYFLWGFFSHVEGRLDWIQTHSAVVASRRATPLATHRSSLPTIPLNLLYVNLQKIRDIPPPKQIFFNTVYTAISKQFLFANDSNRVSRSSFRPLTGWGLHQFILIFPRAQLKARPIE